MSESLTYYSENPAESQKVQLVGTFSLEGSKIESHVSIGHVMGQICLLIIDQLIFLPLAVIW